MRKIVLAACLLLLLLPACAAPTQDISAEKVDFSAEDALPNPSPSLAPTPVPTPKPTPTPPVRAADVEDYASKIEAVKAYNPDVVGYVTVHGTHIDFPIMKAKEDFYYNYHTDKLEKSAHGSIYSYYNAPQKDCFYAITGNNCNRLAQKEPENTRTLFHDLHHIYEYAMGESECRGCAQPLTDTLPDLRLPEGQLWKISIHGEDGLWQLFSVYETTEETEDENLDIRYDAIWWNHGETEWVSSQDDFCSPTQFSDEEIQEWVERHKARSAIDFSIEVPEKAKLLSVHTGGIHGSSKGENIFYFFYLVD